MTPARRTALVWGLAAGGGGALPLARAPPHPPLPLFSEAAPSSTDLVAALLTFFAVGVAVRPADAGHPYGHGKAEHLSALAEAAFLVLASLAIAATAIARLVRGGHTI